MLAREVMTTPVVTMGPRTRLKDAVNLLDRHEITAVPVVNHMDRLVGIVSEADLLHELLAQRRELAATTVGEVMTPEVRTVPENADTADVARLMLETGVKSVPVVQDRHVVGIVSRRDLIRALATSDARIRVEIEGLLAEAGLTGWTASVDDGVVLLSGSRSERDARIARVLARGVPGVTDVDVAE